MHEVLFRFSTLFCNGPDWKEQRRVFVKVMNKSGFETTGCKRAVEHVYEKWRKKLRRWNCKEKSIPFGETRDDISEIIALYYCDPKLVDSFPKYEKEVLPALLLHRKIGFERSDQRIWVRWPILTKIAPDWSGYSQTKAEFKKGYQSLDWLVRVHEEKPYTPEEGPRDFIDHYMDMVDELQKEVGKDSPFYGDGGRKSIVGSLDDMIVGGSSLVEGFEFTLTFLAEHQDWQERMRHELVTKGPSLPEDYLEDARSYLPITWAFLLESFRYANPASFGGPHYAEEDIRIDDDYIIPAYTAIFPGMRHILYDKLAWKEPDDFNPARHLNKAQDECIPTNPFWKPFGVGPRTCLGNRASMNTLVHLYLKMLPEFRICGGLVENQKGAGYQIGMMKWQISDNQLWFEPVN